jgi:hypothetical protein
MHNPLRVNFQKSMMSALMSLWGSPPNRALATPALAQSAVVMPLPGANGYAVIPRQGFTTQVLPMPGGGWLIVPPGAQGRSATILPLPGDGSTATAPFSAAQPCCLGQPGVRSAAP